MIGIMGGGNIYQIYIDSYFLFHLCINFWILFLSRLFLKSRVEIGKILFFSILMSLGECILLIIPNMNTWLKQGLGFIGNTVFMVNFLFCSRSYSEFFKSLLAIYSAALMLGGTLIIFQRIFPIIQRRMALSALLISFLGIGLHFVYKHMYKGEEKGIVEAEIFFFDGNKIRVKALIDTGNSLVEPISKKPVSIIEKESLEGCLDSLRANDFRVIPFCSVGESKGVLQGFTVKKIIIYGRERIYISKKIMIGIAQDKISVKNGYQMILHPKLLNNQEAQ